MATISQTMFSDAFCEWKFCILIEISLRFVPVGPLDNNPVLFLAWRRIGHYPNQCWPDSLSHISGVGGGCGGCGGVPGVGGAGGGGGGLVGGGEGGGGVNTYQSTTKHMNDISNEASWKMVFVIWLMNSMGVIRRKPVLIQSVYMPWVFIIQFPWKPIPSFHRFWYHCSQFMQ